MKPFNFLKFSLTLISLSTFIACDKYFVTKEDVAAVRNSLQQEYCTVEEVEGGALMTCPDGTQAFIKNGADGEDGDSCTIESTDTGAIISCENGTHAEIINGIDGLNGSDGSSCSASQLPIGVLITCDNGSSAIAEHGKDALNPITEIVDPCGKQTAYDEVLLKLADGRILAHYASGNKQHFAVIGVGSYMTTDNTACRFSVDSSGNVSW